jgi:hypothetical protein
MTPDTRLYWDGNDKTYRVTCVTCGHELFQWSHALERRHILDAADATLAHQCRP